MEIGLHFMNTLFILFLNFSFLCKIYCEKLVGDNTGILLEENKSNADLKNFLFIILNQQELNHIEKAKKSVRNLDKAAKIHDISISVKISSEDFNDIEPWIYFTLAEKLVNLDEQALWYILIEEFCEVDLQKLSTFLDQRNAEESIFIGRALYDSEPTIIHHFASPNPDAPFLYPDPRTGIILSRALVKRLSKTWDPRTSKMDFSIDASYEFSSFLLSMGITLQDCEALCVVKNEHCIMWMRPEVQQTAQERVPLERMHFAVKTCKKYHSERIPVVKDTWLPNAVNFGLYSDVEDKSIGTISLNIPNTESGHCGKTLGIIKHVNKIEDFDWLIITDDDTLISVNRLSSFLASFNSSSLIAIGERYGYMAGSGAGFNYPTGGAGMVFSKETVTLLSRKGFCECPANDTPDDMFIGSCLQRHSVPIFHSRRFHQARPEDYPRPLLEGTAPISFHKFWMIDPRKIYKQWLEETQNPKDANDMTNHSEL